MRKQKRIVIYVNEDDYIKLRAKLILMSKTVSGWFREIVAKFIND